MSISPVLPQVVSDDEVALAVEVIESVGGSGVTHAAVRAALEGVERVRAAAKNEARRILQRGGRGAK